MSTAELSRSGTLDVVEGSADHFSVVHFALSLTPPLANRETGQQQRVMTSILKML